MSTNGKMEENNDPTVPETNCTGTESSSQAATPSSRASVTTTKNEPRIFTFEEIIVSPTANIFVKGKGTSTSNLAGLESIGNVLLAT
jgi:hypothetical protein